jgi:hypothetical protein
MNVKTWSQIPHNFETIQDQEKEHLPQQGSTIKSFSMKLHGPSVYLVLIMIFRVLMLCALHNPADYDEQRLH